MPACLVDLHAKGLIEIKPRLGDEVSTDNENLGASQPSRLMLDECGCLASNYGELGYRRLLKHNTIPFDRRLWSQVEDSGKSVVSSMQQVAGRAENEFGNSPDKNKQDERDANIFGKDRCRADSCLVGSS